MCPRCRASLLRPVQHGEVELDACRRCGGLWFDPGELAEVIQESVGSLPEGSSLGPPKAPSDMICPGCGEPLDCHSFDPTGADVFDVDVCAACEGIWLDRGELERVQKSQISEIVERDKTWKTWLFQFLLQLPVEFNFKPRRFPAITTLLFAANVLVMIAVFAYASRVAGIVDLFALYPDRVGQPQWFFSLLSHMFLHGGLLHIAMNMYFLYVLGDNVEDVLGRGGFLLFFLAMGVVGGLGHTALAWGDSTPMVGASGAISGVMAAYAVFFRKAKLTFMLIVFQFKLSAPLYMSIWAGLNVIGLLLGKGNVAWGAHLGGFLGGLVLAFLLDRRVVANHALLRLMRG